MISKKIKQGGQHEKRQGFRENNKELPNCKHIDTKTKKLVLGCPPNRTAH